MPARRLLLALLVFAGACIDQMTGPEGDQLYVLERIGTHPLPTWFYSQQDTWVVVADSLFVPPRRGGTFTVERVQVSQTQGQAPEVLRADYRARMDAGTLVIDNCPINWFCAASLVYSAFELQYDGDTLREKLPSNATWEARLYRRVTTPVRPR